MSYQHPFPSLYSFFLFLRAEAPAPGFVRAVQYFSNFPYSGNTNPIASASAFKLSRPSLK